MLTASHIANVPASAADRSMRPIVWLDVVCGCGFTVQVDRTRSSALRPSASKVALKPE